MTFEDAFDIVDNALFATQGKHLSNLQKAILESAWLGKTYTLVAEVTYCTEGHVKDVASDLWKQLSESLGTRIGKKSFRAIIEQQCQPVGDRADWGDAPDVSVFFGREVELSTLERWILQDHCRLVAILGMVGVGKTSLVTKLAHHLAGSFDRVIWRSLQNAPSVDTILSALIPFLSNQPTMDLPDYLDTKILRLLEHLRASRCLLVLDNVESVLDPHQGNCGGYRAGYEGYGQLISALGSSQHHSCLLLTSREKPQGLVPLEGETLPVRSQQLKGISLSAGQGVLQLKGKIKGSAAQWQALIERYGGNPLALKIVAAAIADFFDSNLANFLDFLKQGPFIFDDIRTLLSQQFERLSRREQEIMYWLAINRESVSLQSLQTDLVHKGSTCDLFGAIATLHHRALIEKNAAGFSQQPVVMEYLIDRFTAQVAEEIATGEFVLFNQHALVKAQAKDYIHQVQERLILQPTIEILVAQMGSVKALTNHLTNLLETLRARSSGPGYAGGNILNLLRQLHVDLRGYNFSGLPIWQANLQDICLHDANFSEADLTQSRFSETLGSILSVAISPAGGYFVTGDVEGTIQLWQIQTGQRLLSCQGHTNWVRSVAFHPDGQTFVSGSYDHTIRLWSVENGQCRTVYQGHRRGICAVTFSPDGQRLASGSADGTIRLWGYHSGQCLKTLTDHTDWVNAIAFSPDGQQLASGSADGTLKLWNYHTGQCLKTFTGHTLGVNSVAFNPDGQTLLSGSADQTIKQWQVASGECLKTFRGHTDAVNAVGFSFDGQCLASGSADQTLKLWDEQTGHCFKTLIGHHNDIWSIAFSPVDQILISGSADQTVKLWDRQTGDCYKTVSGYTHWINAVMFSPDGKCLIGGGFGQTLGIWNYHTGQLLKTLTGHTAPICSVAISQDQNMLASGSADQSIRLWHGQTNQCLQQLIGHRSWVCSVAFSPDGTHLASGSFDRTVKLWQVNQETCLKTLVGHDNVVWSVVFNPLDQTLASGSADHTIKLWDSQTGQCLKTLIGHDNVVWSVAFDPTGQTLVSGSADHTVKLWDCRTGHCLKTLVGHTSWVCSVVFSHGGTILASSSADHTIRLWNPQAQTCYQILNGHTHGVYTIAFSLDDQILASGSQDGTIKLWEVATGKLLDTLRPPRLYEGMNITQATGLTAAQRSTLKTLGAVERSV
ncbi:MAG: NB-ARC domain-containing protein [Cyanobacteria bacterium P01_D01_bin.44]